MSSTSCFVQVRVYLLVDSITLTVISHSKRFLHLLARLERDPRPTSQYHLLLENSSEQNSTRKCHSATTGHNDDGCSSRIINVTTMTEDIQNFSIFAFLCIYTKRNKYEVLELRIFYACSCDKDLISSKAVICLRTSFGFFIHHKKMSIRRGRERARHLSCESTKYFPP